MTEELIKQKAEEIMMQKVIKHNDCIMTPYKTLEDCQLIDFCFEDMVDAFIDGYHECQKEYEWHDLRKDPTDLPKGYAENTRFLCSVKGETLFLVRYGSFWQGNFEVEAWCEIPTFDKDQ